MELDYKMLAIIVIVFGVSAYLYFRTRSKDAPILADQDDENEWMALDDPEQADQDDISARVREQLAQADRKIRSDRRYRPRSIGRKDPGPAAW